MVFEKKYICINYYDLTNTVTLKLPPDLRAGRVERERERERDRERMNTLTLVFLLLIILLVFQNGTQHDLTLLSRRETSLRRLPRIFIMIFITTLV